MGNSSQGNAEGSQLQIRRSVMPEGSGVSFPSLLYEGHLWTTRGRPYKFYHRWQPVCAYACRRLVPSAGLSSQTCSCRRRHSSPEGTFHAGCLLQEHSYAEVLGRYHFLLGKTLPAGNQSRIRQNGETEHGDFSLYSKDCWTQQRENPSYRRLLLISMAMMKNEKQSRINYYTSKKKFIYTAC